MNVNVNVTVNPKLTQGIRVVPSSSKTALTSFDMWVPHEDTLLAQIPSLELL